MWLKVFQHQPFLTELPGITSHLTCTGEFLPWPFLVFLSIDIPGKANSDLSLNKYFPADYSLVSSYLLPSILKKGLSEKSLRLPPE